MSDYTHPPCSVCGEPIYLTVTGQWRHVEIDYAHEPRAVGGVKHE